jgi:uncharacterized protein (DUF433 family)
MRTRRQSEIAYRGEGTARRPCVRGSGLDVWEICEMVDASRSIDDLTSETHLTKRHVELALAYRKDHAEEIRQAIDENNRPVSEWRKLYPFVRYSARPIR